MEVYGTLSTPCCQPLAMALRKIQEFRHRCRIIQYTVAIRTVEIVTVDIQAVEGDTDEIPSETGQVVRCRHSGWHAGSHVRTGADFVCVPIQPTLKNYHNRRSLQMPKSV